MNSAKRATFKQDKCPAWPDQYLKAQGHLQRFWIVKESGATWGHKGDFTTISKSDIFKTIKKQKNTKKLKHQTTKQIPAKKQMSNKGNVYLQRNCNQRTMEESKENWTKNGLVWNHNRTEFWYLFVQVVYKHKFRHGRVHKREHYTEFNMWKTQIFLTGQLDYSNLSRQHFSHRWPLSLISAIVQ